MADQHPITPPPELVEEWANDSVPRRADAIGRDWEIAFATRAAQWGADQELKACCEFLEARHASFVSRDLRADRRPQPQSLAEEAQKALAHLLRHSSTELGSETIRRALERLQELEGQGQLTKESD